MFISENKMLIWRVFACQRNGLWTSSDVPFEHYFPICRNGIPKFLVDTSFFCKSCLYTNLNLLKKGTIGSGLYLRLEMNLSLAIDLFFNHFITCAGDC